MQIELTEAEIEAVIKTILVFRDEMSFEDGITTNRVRHKLEAARAEKEKENNV